MQAVMTDNNVTISRQTFVDLVYKASKAQALKDFTILDALTAIEQDVLRLVNAQSNGSPETEFYYLTEAVLGKEEADGIQKHIFEKLYPLWSKEHESGKES